MQSDDIIWMIISKRFCSFKVKTEKQDFCRNQYNVTGLCNRGSCPLANSQYATIIEEEGKCYLYIKSIERAHKPAELWEKIYLSNSYKQALALIDKHLQYWPQKTVFKVKQRLTKMWQYLIRMRKLRHSLRPELIPIVSKVERREKVREYKALSAAQIEQKIKAELLERLRSANVYGDIYNFAPEAFNEILAETEIESQGYGDETCEVDDETFIDAEDYDDEEELSDLESEDELPEPKRKGPTNDSSMDDRKKRRKRRIEIEIEEEAGARI
ncbi:protein MAK16 homolog [Schistocerca gregaria]|uniref:protein MAK16 homolog n=1 Tax=Schistocerca gregaria TaxID=7010 RepID=UPI00211E24E1|nr:protein MAK16 homolog [Schistocerca gregaria]